MRLSKVSRCFAGRLGDHLADLPLAMENFADGTSLLEDLGEVVQSSIGATRGFAGVFELFRHGQSLECRVVRSAGRPLQAFVGAWADDRKRLAEDFYFNIPLTLASPDPYVAMALRRIVQKQTPVVSDADFQEEVGDAARRRAFRATVEGHGIDDADSAGGLLVPFSTNPYRAIGFSLHTVGRVNDQDYVTMLPELAHCLGTLLRRSQSPAAKYLRAPRLPTQREIEVWTMFLDGWTEQEIADELKLSPETIKTHKSHARDKLDASKRDSSFAFPGHG